jgi:hypothetical protein
MFHAHEDGAIALGANKSSQTGVAIGASNALGRCGGAAIRAIENAAFYFRIGHTK